MLEEKLCQIGFSRNEAKLYISLLKIGSPQAVSVISKKTGLNRTTSYSILTSLEKKGVVSSYNKKTVKYFMANDPNCLVGYLDSKCKTFDYYKTDILLAIPQFRNLTDKDDFQKPMVAFFDGINSVKSLLIGLLDGKEDMFACLPLGKCFTDEVKDILLKCGEIYSKKDSGIFRAIVPDKQFVRDFFNEIDFPDQGKIKLLYVLKSDFEDMFKNQMYIYGNKIILSSFDKNKEYAVLLENKEIAYTQKSIFEMIWNGM